MDANFLHFMKQTKDRLNGFTTIPATDPELKTLIKDALAIIDSLYKSASASDGSSAQSESTFWKRKLKAAESEVNSLNKVKASMIASLSEGFKNLSIIANRIKTNAEAAEDETSQKEAEQLLEEIKSMITKMAN